MNIVFEWWNTPADYIPAVHEVNCKYDLNAQLPVLYGLRSPLAFLSIGRITNISWSISNGTR